MSVYHNTSVLLTGPATTPPSLSTTSPHDTLPWFKLKRSVNPTQLLTLHLPALICLAERHLLFDAPDRVVDEAVEESKHGEGATNDGAHRRDEFVQRGRCRLDQHTHRVQIVREFDLTGDGVTE